MSFTSYYSVCNTTDVKSFLMTLQKRNLLITEIALDLKFLSCPSPTTLLYFILPICDSKLQITSRPFLSKKLQPPYCLGQQVQNLAFQSLNVCLVLYVLLYIHSPCSFISCHFKYYAFIFPIEILLVKTQLNKHSLIEVFPSSWNPYWTCSLSLIWALTCHLAWCHYFLDESSLLKTASAPGGQESCHTQYTIMIQF